MRTVWTDWKPADMRDAAESEARVGFDALRVPVLHPVAALPYYGAQSEYEDHVESCAVCGRSVTSGCSEGEALLETVLIGLGEQHRSAVSN